MIKVGDVDVAERWKGVDGLVSFKWKTIILVISGKYINPIIAFNNSRRDSFSDKI